MPALFKDLIREFSLTPSSVSKYRLSVEACGLNGSFNPGAPGLNDDARSVLDARLAEASDWQRP